MTDSQELKPCPFCGNPPIKTIEGDFACVDCIGTVNAQPLVVWQNAYCWKKIDEQAERIKQLSELLDEKYMLTHSDCGIAVHDLQAEVKDQAETLQRYRKALEKYRPIAIESRFWAIEALAAESKVKQ